MKFTYFLLILALGITACERRTGQDPALYPNENIRDRQTAFKNIGGDMTLLSNAINTRGAIDINKIKQLANELSQHAAKPFDFFNEEDKGGKSRPEVWLQRPVFEMERDKFIASVERFNAAAGTGEIEQIRATFSSISDSCKSCHNHFKIK
ncbi:MAG: cytochrome c [Neisseriaceae bacterium]|nr:cytochrome c [Neisseriaceae bacterium]